MLALVCFLGICAWAYSRHAKAGFDEAARRLMTERPGDVATLASHVDYARAVPTPDHFYPLLYLAGLAAAANRPAEILVEGYAYGSLSMTAYTLDARAPRIATNDEPAAPMPDPSTMPPDQTNI